MIVQCMTLVLRCNACEVCGADTGYRIVTFVCFCVPPTVLSLPVIQTVEMLKREAFGPQEIIVRQGDWGFSMFFITHGNVQIFSEGR